MVAAFRNYAEICFREFGPRVKYWITINEPWVVSALGYGTAGKAPGHNAPAEEPYITAHTQLKAHAEAYHLYQDSFRSSQGGQLGISFNCGWKVPMNASNPSDVEAALRGLEFDLGWFANPVYGPNGDYPEIMKQKVLEKSLAQGYNRSRLPEFTPEEVQRIKGTSDFFGLNFYSSGLTTHEEQPLDPPSYFSDSDTGGGIDPSWPSSGSTWLWVTPFGMRDILVHIKDKYNNPGVFITENGVSDRNGSLTDEHRVF